MPGSIDQQFRLGKPLAGLVHRDPPKRRAPESWSIRHLRPKSAGLDIRRRRAGTVFHVYTLSKYQFSALAL